MGEAIGTAWFWLIVAAAVSGLAGGLFELYKWMRRRGYREMAVRCPECEQRITGWWVKSLAVLVGTWLAVSFIAAMLWPFTNLDWWPPFLYDWWAGDGF